ncbi:MAG TPA: NAD-binding protein [Solirubrobacteraceae bacterium]|nr:NAD-binding protein [Solirubrobacteraceae bacterium]
MATHPILLLGEGDLADEVRGALDALEADVVRLVNPTQREIAEVFDRGPVERAVVVSGDDAFALRTALMVRDADPDVELLLTYFDQTTSDELCERIRHCRIVSMADIVAPVLAGPVLDEELGALTCEDGRARGTRTDGDEVEEVEVEIPDRNRTRALLSALLNPYDKSAALLFYGALGLVAILLLETLLAAIVLPQNIVDAFYGASKTLVTVDPNDKVAGGPAWFKTFVAILMLIALVFEAFFTAGIVNRLIDRRLTGLVGRRAVPRRDHVIVVGLGQVGLRLCLLLRDCGVAVVAADDREEGENVGQAREAGLPVVIGRGADPSLLRRLSLDRAMAVAAVTDDDLENLSIGMAVHSLNEDLRVVLRVGDGRLANETRSLFKIGLVRDVHRIAAGLIAAQATGSGAESVICRDDRAHLVHDDGTVEEAAIAASA